MIKSPIPADQVNDATTGFNALEDALQQVKAKLKDGCCVMVWPEEGTKFRVASWTFESDAGVGATSAFAPTVPHDLEDLPQKRQESIFRRR
ncbi:hypothetical protein WKW77_05735 [Variovorax ureilyticus]|uniref:Uncharacterized protein n=1 Tax=Variovorax ureilyticus TaxID=1836198 RepID=A0ABU8VA81_9BURK